MVYKINKVPKVPRVELTIWLFVRVSLVICMMISVKKSDTTGAYQALWALIFTHLWDFFQIFGNNSFISKVTTFSQTSLTLFIFIGCTVGSFMGLFASVSWSDTAVHILSGIICGVFGYDLASIIQGEKKTIQPTLAALFAVTFSLGIAVCWEFYEFIVDSIANTSLQCRGMNDAGLIDTMTDLIAGAIGGIIGMIIIVMKRRKKK